MEVWLKMMGLDAGIGARLLGISDEQMTDCLSGETPRPIALACSALYHRLEPWDQSKPGNKAAKGLQKHLMAAQKGVLTS